MVQGLQETANTDPFFQLPWGNRIYAKNAEGHETFFSLASTSTSGFFVDNAGTIIKTFTNDFSNCTVPSSVHTMLIGAADK